MPRDFFQSVAATRAPLPMIAACGDCGLYKTCRSPKMRVSGKGRQSILIVAEAPGEEEDRRGIQLCGPTGQDVEKTLRKFDVEMRRDCWLTNALICRPIDNIIHSDRCVGWCRPNLIKTVRELKPHKIILLGNPAVESLLGWLYKPSPGGITLWAGRQIPEQTLNAWICPTFHPSFVSRSSDNPVVRVIWEQHLKAACELPGQPWEEVPDYKSMVGRMHHPRPAADFLRQLFKESPRPIAFDYETNTLKPDSPDAYIHSCSVSDGVSHFAFPVTGPVVPALKQFLRSPVPKIAHNAKFEDRWSVAKLGVPWIRNLVHDTMIAAHVLDCREGSHGLDFLAFTMLGFGDYASHISPYLASAHPGGNSPNKIKQAPMDQLLLYGGLDSLLTWKIAKKQAALLGLDFQRMGK